MKQRFIFILAAFCMLWSVYAQAAQNAGVGGMTYTSSGQSVTAIPAGQELTAEITVTNHAGQQQSNLFSMSLYQNGRIQGVNVDSRVLEPEETYTYTARLTMPADTAGCVVRTVLWDGFENMEIRYSGSIFPNGETGLKKLLVDGALIDNTGSTDIDVTIPVTQKSAPIVEAIPLDGGTSLTVQSPAKFPGKTVISAVAADGTGQVYTINYKTDSQQTLVSNLKFIAEGLPEEQFKTWNQKDRFALGENLQNKSKFYGDRGDNICYDNVAEELKGCTAVQTSLDWINGGGVAETISLFKGSTAVPWISFEISRTASIKVLSERELPSFKQGDWNINDPDTGWAMRKSPAYYAQRFVNGALNANLPYIYEKIYAVEDGQPITVVIPNAGVGGFPYTVLIDFPYEK